MESIEEKVVVQVGLETLQVTYLGAGLPESDRHALCKVIQKNKDLFAWVPSDMPGIDPKVMCHKLSVFREAKPIAQRKRKMGTERKLVVESEVAKLLEAKFIREIQYTTWLANVVMVKKTNGKWRMCADYTNLNKACPKDAYPLPNIDRLNAGATYQRLMNKIFKGQIGKNVEVYVDDMVVKSNDLHNHIADLVEVFHQVRHYDMRLNPEKCVFGIVGGKFLGFMLSARGIEANPDKCRAVIDMRSPQNVKEVQRLAGRLTTLSSGAGIILEGPMGVTLEQSMHFVFRASNNQAEYEALLAGLRLAGDIGVRRLICRTDSKIVSEQVNNHFQVKDPNLLRYIGKQCSETCQLRTTLHLKLPTPSIAATESMAVEETSSTASNATWITKLLDFILHGKESAEPLSAKNVRTQAARYSVIGEIHQGICGSHSGGRTLAAKVLRAGYYWPTLKSDCAQFVKRCVQCQKHGNLIHASAEQLHSIIEHPQLNGQAEAANKVILNELKKHLGDAKGAWAEELFEVLWAYRCTPQSTTRETPFRLMYGTDAMIPVEVGEPSFRCIHFNENSDEVSIRAEIDTVEETRNQARVVVEACRQRMTRRFNTTLNKREFKEGDLVWRVQGTARRNPREGKLAANWDGPFRIRHNLQNGVYKLEELSGKVIPRTWNSTHLKTYFS
uniref:Retrovirus-related Pol polyprotein from transposon opus n=1 Tax=Cajanus cajan TaxID=3821 RepID=A0A151SM41_CAJCA|nr:Retrovirus-related Pol polyprotein from transposon opus [Cajanus cajan]